MSIEQELEKNIELITKQEALLYFDQFNMETAWQLGSALRLAASSSNASVVIEITVNNQRVFYSALPGTTPSNDDWVRRKRNVVSLSHRSTYGVGLAYQKQGVSFIEKTGLPASDYATHGGGFPIKLHACGCIGSIVVSGLSQAEDHELIISVLADFLKVDVPHNVNVSK